MSKREFATQPGLNGRMGLTTWSSWGNTSEPTGTQRKNLQIVTDSLPEVKSELKQIMDKANEIKSEAYRAGMPYLRGDLPDGQ
jgi:hypothetical protein